MFHACFGNSVTVNSKIFLYESFGPWNREWDEGRAKWASKSFSETRKCLLDKLENFICRRSLYKPTHIWNCHFFKRNPDIEERNVVTLALTWTAKKFCICLSYFSISLCISLHICLQHTLFRKPSIFPLLCSVGSFVSTLFEFLITSSVPGVS